MAALSPPNHRDIFLWTRGQQRLLDCDRTVHRGRGAHGRSGLVTDLMAALQYLWFVENRDVNDQLVYESIVD